MATNGPRNRIALFGRLFPDAEVEDLIDLAVQLGYGGIDIRSDGPLPGGGTVLPPDSPPARLRDLKRRLDDAGLAVPCLYTWTGAYLRRRDTAERQHQLDELTRRFDLALALDCPLLQHGPGGESRTASNAEFEEAALWLRRAGEAARDRGVRLVMEGGETLCESSESTLRLFDLIGQDLAATVGLIYDPANMLTREFDYGPAALAPLFARTFEVHLKDERRVSEPAPGRRRPFASTVLGKGDVDWPPLLGALQARGYGGWFACEGLPDMEPLARAKGELEAALRLTRDAGFRWGEGIG